MATNHDDQLGKIYQTTLNELNCAFGVSFSRFHAVAIMVMVCGRHGIGPLQHQSYAYLPKLERMMSLSK